MAIIKLSAKWQERLGTKTIDGVEGLEKINQYKHRMATSSEAEIRAWNNEQDQKRLDKKQAKRDAQRRGK